MLNNLLSNYGLFLNGLIKPPECRECSEMIVNCWECNHKKRHYGELSGWRRVVYNHAVFIWSRVDVLGIEIETIK